MLYLCSALGVIAVLLGSTAAAPTPAPHVPVVGEIVHLVPAHGNGPAFGLGATTAHPHIALGQDGNGNIIVAPVSHSQAAQFRPNMPSTGMHPNLSGNVHLNHVVAPPNAIQPAHGVLAGAHVSPQTVANIRNAKALVETHDQAGYMHTAAEDAHSGAQQAHIAAANVHTAVAVSFGPHSPQGAQHHAAAASHRTQANYHGQQAANHHATAAAQHASANAVNGPNAHAHATAAASFNAAVASQAGAVLAHNHATAGVAHLAAASARDSASRTLMNLANQIPPTYPGHQAAVTTANTHANFAAGHRATALTHAPSSLNQPDPATSLANAQASQAQAAASKNAVPPHLHVL